MNGTSIALGIFLLYWLFISVLDRKGILQKHNISTFGPLPILMIRTTKGLKLLDILARPKLYWRSFANLGILLMFAGMIAMFLVIALSDFALYSSFLNGNVPQPGKYNSARNIFLIPGVNEFIPFTWGVIALIVTLVVHEFSHAILCRVESIRVKSMGILLALIPVGGFAEPDDEQLFGKKEEVKKELSLTATIEEIRGREEEKNGSRKTERSAPDKSESRSVTIATRTQRARILAAGVMANFSVAFIAFLLFFGPVLGAIAPSSDAMILSVNKSSPADLAGLQKDMIITQINDTNVATAVDLLTYLDTVNPGDSVRIYATKDGVASVHDLKTVSAPNSSIGVLVGGVVEGSPAAATGIETGMTIIRINNTKMQSIASFINFMAITQANQVIEIELLPSANYTGKLSENGTVVLDVQLSSNPSESTHGFLGVIYGNNGIADCPTLGISIWMPQAKLYLEDLKQIPSLLITSLAGWIILFGLPIYGFTGEGFRGFSGTIMQFYHPVGWAEPLGIGIFWIANTLLWIGWLNFYVGLFNCLPAVPLDGGHVFRDYTYSFIYRLTRSETTSEKVSSSITASFSMLILFSFIFMIFGPFIGQWMGA